MIFHRLIFYFFNSCPLSKMVRGPDGLENCFQGRTLPVFCPPIKYVPKAGCGHAFFVWLNTKQIIARFVQMMHGARSRKRKDSVGTTLQSKHSLALKSKNMMSSMESQFHGIATITIILKALQVTSYALKGQENL